MANKVEGKEKALGIIAISELGASVQMFRKGGEGKCWEFKNSPKQNKDKNLKSLLDAINKSNYLAMDYEVGYDLFISTEDSYRTLEEKFKTLKPAPGMIKFLRLPLGTTDPILETQKMIKNDLEQMLKLLPPFEETQKLRTDEPSRAHQEDQRDSSTSCTSNHENKEILLRMETKIDKISAALESKPVQPLNNSELQRKKPPPSRPVTAGLPCNFEPAPDRVKHLQRQFCSQLRQKHYIRDDPSGPKIVFGVNSSRLISDIERDLKKHTSNEPIFLLVFKPTNNPQESSERQVLLGFDQVQDAAFLLVDLDNKYLYECTTNEAALNSVIQFLKIKSLAI